MAFQGQDFSMFPPVRFSSLVCLGCGLFGQSVNDLNSLVLEADRFATRQMAPARARTLDLYRIVGTGGGDPETLLEKGVDLDLWTLMYEALPPEDSAPGPPGGPWQTVNIQCRKGMFTELAWSPLPIFDCKSLEQVWITLTLDAAIEQLRGQGFTRGFTSLTVMRPLYPRISDECTFVFKCVPDQAFVGISAQTGKWLWTEPFSH